MQIAHGRLIIVRAARRKRASDLSTLRHPYLFVVPVCFELVTNLKRLQIVRVWIVAHGSPKRHTDARLSVISLDAIFASFEIHRAGVDTF